MSFSTVQLQIQCRIKDDKFQLHACWMTAWIVFVIEVGRQLIVVLVVLILDTKALADLASVVFFTKMLVQFVFGIKMKRAKFALWVSTKRQVGRIARFNVALKSRFSEERKFVGETFLASDANVTEY